MLIVRTFVLLDCRSKEGMIKNRVRELRKKHGYTLEKLGEMVGVTHQTNLTLPLAQRLGEALGEDVGYLLGLTDEPTNAGFIHTADAEPYRDEANELAPAHLRKNPNIERWRIIRPVIDRAGVPNGAIVYVDRSPIAIESLKNRKDPACVLGEVSDATKKSVVIARQFIPPSLLITNSSGTNEPSLDLSKNEARVLGIIRGQFIRFDN
jgi:transcriptional regulator with XRE-family HTH domain